MFRSISTVKADLAQAEFGVSGKGIVWAVVATGVDANHPHFKPFRNLDLPKPLYHVDYSNYKLKLTKSEQEDVLYEGKDLADLLLDKRYRVSKPTDSIGLGTGVAGVIAGQSTHTEYGQLMKGLAPETKIISFKIFDHEGKANELDALAALLAIQRINEENADLLIHGVLIPVSFPWDARNLPVGSAHSALR